MPRLFLQIRDYTCELCCLRYAILKIRGTYTYEDELVKEFKLNYIDEIKDFKDRIVPPNIYGEIAAAFKLNIESHNGLSIEKAIELSKEKRAALIFVLRWENGVYHSVVFENMEREEVITMDPSKDCDSDYRIRKKSEIEQLRNNNGLLEVKLVF